MLRSLLSLLVPGPALELSVGLDWNAARFDAQRLAGIGLRMNSAKLPSLNESFTIAK